MHKHEELQVESVSMDEASIELCLEERRAATGNSGEHRLYRSQVSAALDQVSGKCMAECVRSDFFFDDNRAAPAPTIHARAAVAAICPQVTASTARPMTCPFVRPTGVWHACG